ncbi:YdcF family protein [Gordonia sp. zg691]|uniref:YdcF family protein n=1 Tax=Gordonia jinghuaiqii TaxID=2758710 RepID=A0A7D7QYQ1_9ACTN|nr:YdcF family protein [Gordonia jinghuaiqii]MBD0861884.1 YdcF family protein [Gordonia jinghuaiqii]MCR5977789.1 YdcF family protein [Gordonia jinghuaiqii]QMT02449.1 YdcF family protein [Gordonia jinghuaiqii]
MRRRTLMSTVAAAAVAATASVAITSAPNEPVRSIEKTAISTDFGSVDLGSSELGTPNSVFLWENPGARYIVVLGAKFGTLGQTPQILTQRLNVAANLAKKHPFNRMIVSGGDTHWLPVSEAQFMNLGLIRRGIPMWQMVNEGRSTSTVQNAQYTVGMMKAMGASGAVIVTNGFHMERAMKNFRDAAKKQGARITFRPAYA